MANLLPQSFREDITSEYRLRLATTGMAILAVVLLGTTALLAPSFILTESRLEQKQATLDSLSAAASGTSTEQSQEIIAATNEKLSVIAEETEKLQPTDMVSLITQAKPVGVSVRSISVQEAETENATQSVSISGIARTRDALLTFEDNLNNQAQIQQVDLPIETLAARQNAQFSLTITVKPL